MLDFEATEDDREHGSTLGEIMHLVDMPFGVTGDGWNGESARLFAIDIAMTVIRRNLDILTESERQLLIGKLQEARTLVVAGRDPELGFIQANIEAQLPLSEPGPHRQIRLIAIDSLLPSPYRAALVSTRNALSLGAVEVFTDLSGLIRDRLLARLGEGSLVWDPSTLFRIA